LAQVLHGRARLEWVAGAGHDPAHPLMVKALEEALQSFAVTHTFPD
jgi:proline iminopeptidase